VGPVLVGRKAELDRIEALLDAARGGGGAALVIRGEPGIGKTALLAAAREGATGMQVTRAAGVESEAGLPFAALGELAAPLLDGIDELPEPQARALSAALALAPSEGGVDRLAIFAGFLSLLGTAARRRPLLVLVDDAHWLDRPSAECLGYAARRLDGLDAALLVAARAPTATESLAGWDADELVLAGLARGDALELLAGTGLAPAVAETLLELSLGNPLALVELSAALSEEQRRGVAPVSGPPGGGGALGAALERRVAAAGAEAQRLLVVAAASLDRALAPIIAAARDLGVPDRALEEAEAAALIEVESGELRFAHPLLRAVSYGSATGADRRRAHGALAAHTGADARAWHLAAAAIGPDEEVAGELDRSADRAGARGAHEAASDALERAAQLSEDARSRWRRLFAAGISAALSGAYERSAALLESSAETEDEALRARSRHMLAMVSLNGGIRHALENHRLLSEEANAIAGADPAMAALMHADAAVTATVAGLCDLVLDSAERAVAALPDDAPVSVRCQAYSIHAMGLGLKGRTPEAAVALDRVSVLLDEIDPVSPAAQSISFALMSRFCTGDVATLREETLAFAAAAREARSLGILPWFALQSADAGYRLGRWPEAEREIDEAVTNAELSGQLGPLSIGLVIRARIHAARGREEDAREDATRGVEIGEPVGYGSPRLWSLSCLGFLELGLGRIDEAIEELEQAQVLADIAGLEDPLIVPWAADLVEAYARAGRADDAERLAASLSAQAERSGAHLARALAARCRGLVARRGFERHFDPALEHHREAGSPLERGRTLLALGARLHRARRRVEARERLREALAIFDDLGATPWSLRARDELRAAGAVERRRFDDPDELTGQEVRVAEAVARGLTNREVAAELFLSPKTIDFHLGRVYRKLGIHSRAELATLVAEGRLEGATAGPTGDGPS
jgi:DNA-binding CsgD family transcriptional regulator